MGLSTPQRHLQCSKCRKKYLPLYWVTGNTDYHCWQQVLVLEERGSGLLCKCGNCGHEYISKSKAARDIFSARTIKTTRED